MESVEHKRQHILEMLDSAKRDVAMALEASDASLTPAVVEAEIQCAYEHLNRIQDFDKNNREIEISKAEAHASRAIRDVLYTWAILSIKKLDQFVNDYKGLKYNNDILQASIVQKHELMNLLQICNEVNLDKDKITELRRAIEKFSTNVIKLEHERSFLNKLTEQAKRDRVFFLLSILSFIFGIVSAISSFAMAFDGLKQLIQNVLEYLGIISNAHAATVSANNPSSLPINYKEILNLLFTVSALAAFFWSFVVSIHNDSTAKRQAAKSYAHLFGGILIGSAKSTLGL